jgi:hypothetical protein
MIEFNSLIPKFLDSPFFLIEDPELSELIKTLERMDLPRCHQFRGHPLLQFQKAAMIDPLQDGKDETAKKPILLKGKTAVEIDEKGVSIFRYEDVTFVSQVHVNDPPPMDFLNHLFQV